MKKIKILVFSLITIFVVPFMVNAKEVTVSTFDELKENNESGDVINYVGEDLTLVEDLNLNAYLNIKSDTTLNLNGHTLTLPDVGWNYSVTVYGDNTLTIEGDGNVLVNGILGIWTTASGKPKIVINGGTFNQTGDYYMFGLVNGEMEINDGTFNAPYCVVNNLAGEYNGTSATLTINGGTFNTVDEYSSPIMNSDMAIINNGEFTSKGKNGNSIYTSSTGTTIINKGKFVASGDDAINIYNEGTTTIKDGNFESKKGTSIFDDTDSNEDAKTTASGGTYVDKTADVTPNVADGYIQYRVDDNTIAIGKSSMKVLVNEIDESVQEVQLEIAAIEAAIIDGQTIGKYYDIDYAEVDPVDHVIRTLPESENEETITLDVSSFPTIESGKERIYTVYRFHDNEVKQITDVTDNGDNTITFKSDKFSTYGVAYEDTDSVQPREDEETNKNSSNDNINPPTGDNIKYFIILGIISSLGIGVSIKKLNS